MASAASVGESKNRNSYEAGREATEQAVAVLEQAPRALLVIATAGYDQEALLRGVRSVANDAVISGCTSAGIITRTGSDEGVHAVAVLALCSRGIRFTSIVEQGLSRDPRGIGARLGVACQREGASVVLLFPDGLTGNITALVRALDLSGPKGLVVFGGAAGELHLFEHTYQYGNDGVHSDAVAALLLSGDFDVEVAISHGCQLMGLEHIVTRASEGTVYELDGRPAWHVMREYIDEPTDTFSANSVPYLCLAQALPKHPAAGYGEYIIRLPLRLDAASGAMFFPGELRQGDHLWMARREIREVSERAVRSAAELASKGRGSEPLFVLQADCTGRGRMLFGDSITERVITPVQDAFRGAVPWIGFHSYGEIAPIEGQTYYHNYTMALCAVYERR